MTRSSSLILQLGVRAATPFAVAVALYLLFAGHNRPGGGFAAGLVIGSIVILRATAGLQPPTHATALTAGGVLVVTAVAFAPVLWGDVLLDQTVTSFELPLFGPIKTGGALPFDIGVTMIVVGLIVALMDGLSSTNESSLTSKQGDL